MVINIQHGPANSGYFIIPNQNEIMRSHDSILIFFKGWGDWWDIQTGYDIINFSNKKFKVQTVGSGSFSSDMFKIGKKAARRLLNEQEHNEFPKI